MSSARDLLHTTRPRQWIKNVLVFAAPGAAGVLDQARELRIAVTTFVAFSLAAAATYVWNDLLDIDADRRHPHKRHRPIAAGRVSIASARAAGVLLPVAALAVAALTGRVATAAIVAIYLVVTSTYSVALKHVAVVDLLAVAAGFVLRAVGGAVAVDVPMSRWFVLCISFGSMFIVVGKRYAELNELGAEAGTRATLSRYTTGYLRMLLTVSCSSALLSYCVWAFETSEATDRTGLAALPFYELSIVPMAAALFRYLLVLEHGGGAAPEDVFARDRVLQVVGVVWIAIYGVAVYAA